MANATVPPHNGDNGGSLEFFIISCLLTTMGLAGALGFLVFSIRTRNIRILKMSSPHLNMVTCVGCCASYLTCLVWSLPHLEKVRLTEIHDVICKIKPWLLTYSFTIIFGPCITKSWRVQQIFKYVPRKKIVIKDRVLLMTVLTLLLVDTVLLALWTGIDLPAVAQLTKQSWVRAPGNSAPLTSSSTSPVCYSRHLAIWLTIVCIYKLATLLYGAYISWTIRSISIPSMNDSGTTTLAITGTAVIGGATVALVTVTEPWSHASDICAVLGIWLCTTLTMTLVFIPKVMLLKSYKTEQLLETPIGNQVVHSPTSSLHKFEEDCYQLTAENRRLKHLLKQKEEELCRARDKGVSGKPAAKLGSGSQLADSGIVCEERRPCAGQQDNKQQPPPQSHHPPVDSTPVYQTLDDDTPPPVPPKMAPYWYDSDNSLGEAAKIRRRVVGDHVPADSGQFHQLRQPDGYEKLEYFGTANHRTPATAAVTSTNTTGHIPARPSIPLPPVSIPPSSARLYEEISNCPLHGQLLRGYHGQCPPEPVPPDRLSTHEIASAISESYDMDDDGEALSYISTCISTIPSGAPPKRRKRPHKTKKQAKRKRTRFAISNDQYYPRQAASQGEQGRGEADDKGGNNAKDNEDATDAKVYFIDMDKNCGSASFV